MDTTHQGRVSVPLQTPEALADAIASLCGAEKVLEITTSSSACPPSHALQARGIPTHLFDPAAHSMLSEQDRPLPFSDGEFQTIVSIGLPLSLEEEDAALIAREFYRVARRFVVLQIPAPSPSERDRRWWETRFFEAGFRKHPALQSVLPFESFENETSLITLFLEKVPATALLRYPVAALKAERDLHMDMLRETGRRSDAHIARYQLARAYLRSGDVVLDAACGLGYGSALLAQSDPSVRVVGIDSSAYAIDYANANFVPYLCNAEFWTGDACDLSRFDDQSVDLIVSFETIEHLEKPEHFLTEAKRVLRPGGRFICSVPNMWVDETGNDPNPWHFHVFDFEKLADLCGDYLLVKDVYRQNAAGGMKSPNHPRTLRRLQPPIGRSQDAAEWWLLAAERCEDDSLLKTQKAAWTPSAAVASIASQRTFSPAPSVPAQNNIVLLSCFLPLHLGAQSCLTQLSRELHQQGLQLFVLAEDARIENGDVPGFRIPFALRDFPHHFPQCTRDWSTVRNAQRLAERDRAWVGTPSEPLDSYLHGAAVCSQVLEEVVSVLNPACILVWGSTLPQSVLLRQIAEDRQIPGFFIERGLFPETLMLENRGNGAYTDLNTSVLSLDGDDLSSSGELYAAARAFYRTQRPCKYPQPSALSKDQFMERYNPDRKRIISFFGLGDPGSGLVPRSTRESFINSPFFAGSKDCFLALIDALSGDDNAVLLYKPHPDDREDYSACESNAVRVIREANLHNVLEYSDVMAFMLGTVQYDALFYEKPLLLLARSALAGKGAAYELTAETSLRTLIQEAFERKNFDEKSAGMRRFVESALRNYLFKLSDEIPARHGLSDMARFIGANSFPHRTSTEPANLIRDLREALAGYRKARRSAEDYLSAARDLLRGKQFEPAASLLREAVQIHAGHNALASELAAAEKSLEQQRRAHAGMVQMLNATAESSRVGDDLSQLIAHLDAWTSATTQANRRLKLDEAQLQALRAVAHQCMSESRFTDAAKLFGQLSREMPQDIDALLGQVICCCQRRQTTTAELLLSRILSLEPDNAKANELLRSLNQEESLCQT